MKKTTESRLFCGDFLLTGNALIVVLLYAVIFTISPLNGEDYALTRYFPDHNFFDRVQWVINRSFLQASTWNARLGEQLAIFWLSMPKIYFTLFAVFVFLTFNYLIAAILDERGEANKKAILSLIFIFSFWPGLELFFWGAVNAGYLHPLAVTMFCIYSYRSRSAIEKIRDSKYFFLIISVAGLLAGLSFENIPIAVAFYMISSLALAGPKFFSWKTFVPILAIGIGWILLILAPSTTHRRHFYNNVFGVDGYSAEYFLGRMQNVFRVFLENSWPLLLVTLFLSYWTYQNTREPKRLLLLVSVILLVVASVIPAPYTEPRAFSLAWALMMTISIAGAYELIGRVERFKLIYSLLFVSFLYFPIKAAHLYSDFSMLLNERDFYIRKMSRSSACKEGIEVEPVNKAYPYKYLNNRDNWYQENPGFVGKYYGCKVIIK